MRHAALLTLTATLALSRVAGAEDPPPPASPVTSAAPAPQAPAAAEPASALAALAAMPDAAPGCLSDGSGFLRARLRGDLDADIDWRGDGLECRGMRRPDGQGLRMRFAGSLADGTSLAFLFSAPVLAEGADAQAVPINLTVVREGAAQLYGTLGESRCTLDHVTQRALEGAGIPPHTWRVAAQGFCTGPARQVGGQGSLLLTRFDFAGRVTFADDEPPRPEPAK
jgi:hypothetical protein